MRQQWPLVALLALGSLACVHLTAIPVFEDEGSQMRWIARALAAGEWLAPLEEGKPLELWLAAPQVALGMPMLLAMRSLHVLAGALTSVLTYRLARLLGDTRAAWFAAVMVAICPFTVYLQRLALADGILCAASLWALWSSLRLLQGPAITRAGTLGASQVLAALAKLPVGFICLLDVPLALALMPRARRRELGAARRLLWWAHAPALLFAAGMAIIAFLRVQQGRSPGFGLRDFIGVGLGGYRDIGAALGLPPPTLLVELSAQLTMPVIVLALVGLAVAAWLGDWRHRWLILVGSVPMLGIGLLASFWYSRYLLFALPPLLIAAVLGWGLLAQRLQRGRVRMLAAPLTAAALVGALWLMGRQSLLLIVDPIAARWSALDRFQYFTGWGSGYGYPQAARYVLEHALPTTVVFALDGHSPWQLLSYLPADWRDRVRPIDYGMHGEHLSGTAALRLNLQTARSAWLVVPEPLLERYLEARLGRVDPIRCRRLASFQKPDAGTRLGVYEVSWPEGARAEGP